MVSLVKGTSATTKFISSQLINFLNDIPLHNYTKDRLNNIIERNCHRKKNIDIIYKISDLFQNYERNRLMGDKRTQYKSIESLIWFTYFQWDNSIIVPIGKETTPIMMLPTHLQPFLRSDNNSQNNYQGLLNNWPLEYHYDILHNYQDKDKLTKDNDKSKKVSTLRNLWIQNDSNAVSMTLNQVNIESHPLISPILNQIQFLNNTLWKNTTKGHNLLPIVEIPLTVHGETIPEVRFKNLIKDKLNTVNNVLLKQWPALYNPTNIAEMLTLLDLSNTATHRDTARCYDRCFLGKMYQLDEHSSKWQYHVVQRSGT